MTKEKKNWELLLEKYQNLKANYEKYVTENKTGFDVLNKKGQKAKETVEYVFKDILANNKESEKYLKEINYSNATGTNVLELFEKCIVLSAMFENEGLYRVVGMARTEIDDNTFVDYDKDVLRQCVILANKADKNYDEKEMFEKKYIYTGMISGSPINY